MVRSERAVADYDALFEPIRQARHDKSGKQAGDPALAAQVVLALVDAEQPPVHLLLGDDALSIVRKHLATLNDEIDTWEVLSRSTEFVSPVS